MRWPGYSVVFETHLEICSALKEALARSVQEEQSLQEPEAFDEIRRNRFDG